MLFKISISAIVGLSICAVLLHFVDNPAKRGETTVSKGALHPAQPYLWRNVEIVGGGFVSGIVFSPKQKDLLYARTDIGGAYRWNQDTKRWVPLMDWVSQKDSNLLGVESVCPDPTDANRVYAAVGTYTQSWAGNGAMLRSNDQGRHWLRTDLPFKLGGNEDGRSIGERIAVDPNKNGTLYFGSRNDGLWKSDDYAATWKKVDSFPVSGKTNGVGIGFVLFDAHSSTSGSNSKTIYVAVAAPGVNLYKSQNGGKSWEPVARQPEGLIPHHGVLAADGTLYLTYGNAPGPNGMSNGAVWKQNVKTGNWTNITPVAPGSSNFGTFGYAGLSVDASHPNTLMVSSMDKWSSGDDLWRTTDAGAHWSSVKAKSVRDSSGAPFLKWGRPEAELGHWIGALAIDPFRPGHVLYGTGATIWGSEDANALDANETSHWNVRAQGLEETAVIDLVSPPTGAHLLSGLGDIGGFRHDDLASPTQRGMHSNPIISSTESLDFAEKAPNIVARVGSGSRGKNSGLSSDGGATWNPFSTEPKGIRESAGIALSADGKTIIWSLKDGKPHYSKDRGVTWAECVGVPAKLKVIADRVDSRKFYAFDSASGKLHVSKDGGVSFSQGATLKATRGHLKATFGKEGELWLAQYGDGLFHSTDSGATFAKIASVQEGDAIGFGKAAPGANYPALYLAGKVEGVSGVFRSDDRGVSWTRINDDQHQYGWIGQVITGDPRIYGRVYLGTNGRGIPFADAKR